MGGAEIDLKKVAGAVSTSVSGNIVQVENVSGQVLNVSVSGLSSVPTLLRNGYTSIGSISGGVIISSGTIIRVSLQNIPGNDIVWLGATGVNSGTGYLLVAGNEKQINIDNLNKVCVYAQTSGEYICYLAETE